MEEELRCPVCQQIYSNPVLLPCGHAMCLNCALQRQCPPSAVTVRPDPDESDTSGSDVDKLSVASETDSGVVCGSGGSRPASYLGSPEPAALALLCRKCGKHVYFDEHGAYNLPRYRTLQKVVDRYVEAKDVVLKCQLCESSPRDAAVLCEQCEVLYCEPCRERCHPSRGPLAQHRLTEPRAGRGGAPSASARHPVPCSCPDHPGQPLVNYCVDCKLAVCNSCVQDGKHRGHELQSLAVIAKAHKTDLSFHLQQLTERAKSAADYIHQLKGLADVVTDNCAEFEATVSERCDELMELIQQRRHQLIQYLHSTRDDKIRSVKQQVSQATVRLQQTNGLLMFCIEALKERDDSAFLQISQMLTHRVASYDLMWGRDITDQSINPDLDLSLETDTVRAAIQQFNFIQMKPPGPPTLLAEECTAENNRLRLRWRPHPTSHHDGFIVQLNDGVGFQDAYCGREAHCLITGLHFNTRYKCRVKGYNSTGDGPPSDAVSLRTTDVAWFTFDPSGRHPDVSLSRDNSSATCDSFESRVALASVGFSRGTHYWEFSVDKFDGNADPAFGMARAGVSRDCMLGKDNKGWSMYIDGKRSWLMHQDIHSGRAEGGIKAGDTVGILLNLTAQKLTFYINDVVQGRIDFGGLQGTFYPAVSLNRNVAVTLHTALEPPVGADC
ncbi:E3 ubiquitin-protein ligase TRIM9-like isoform X2 [Amphibalanus amphitrite]|uniref:E3 ubiquitin-protein ligase TRIM9-like isoform X2 n=1 Tax=Amphibalanus amphitrite TaxID=1232801 RepID=UPI001C923D9F|nr:E3 ubiquitin-protein ligase TRIM9-like isoform X2 [Amphibalanus amphitrite]